MSMRSHRPSRPSRPSHPSRSAAAGLFLLALAPLARADVLFDNGGFITDPAGGTGSIAGLPISRADGFTIPGQSFTFSTTGIAATVATGTASADDFLIPDGEQWDLSHITLFAFQTSQTTATVTSIRINLWTEPPYSADSPPPVPSPVPMPVLAAPVVIPAPPGTFVCHRQSPSSTGTVRPVFAYKLSLDSLPAEGVIGPGVVLGPGRYWVEWAFEGASSPSANVFQPLVTPRTQEVLPPHNARLLNDPFNTGARVWFEGREGFVSGVSDGRAYSLPFILEGTRTILPPDCPADFNNSGAVSVQDIFDFLTAYFMNDPSADVNNSGGISVQDIFDYLALYFAGC
ncbi:MAG: hypothetical protein IT438_16715 [Phycisphaerales bacterium]|nr:hypothetical protein [Phycisphaerales bacterium]